MERESLVRRPLGVLLTVVVVIGALQAGFDGGAAPIVLALVAFCAAMGWLMFGPDRGGVAVAVVLAAASVALAWLQPQGATEIAASVAVYIAASVLGLRNGALLAGATVLGLDLAMVGHATAEQIVAATLLCVLLFAIAIFMDRAREGEERASRLVEELREARAAETRAAAVAERGRIAAELHDVLAHALSGLAVQLEGARMLATREQASPALRETIERSGRLAREGLVEARRAVGALRGDDLPGPDRLPALVQDLRRDLGVDASLRVEGTPRPLAADAGLALYRGAQEALTNVARHAPGTHATVVVRFTPDRTVLTVENPRPERGQTPQQELNTFSPANGANAIIKGSDPLIDDAGGWGLAGMRERVTQAGGSVVAGPCDQGFRVELEFRQ